MSLEMFSVDYDVELADARETVLGAWVRGWTIPPPLTVSEWADTFPRIIAKGAGAEPGDWNTSRTPYLREIMDALSDHSPVQIVDFKKSAQIGATEVGINWCGYVIARGLDSMIVAQPVKDLARSWSTSKFEPAVALMPELRDKIGTDNTLEKTFPGGTLWVIWANSSNQLRQRTARYLFLDEVDEYPKDLNGQGSATAQLEARALSYGDRAKVYRACTPTVANKSQIDAGFMEGDQRYYKFPCPHCGAHQVLDRDNLMETGQFACVASGCVIDEHHKTAMLRERSACTGCGKHPLRVIDHATPTGLVYADVCGCGTVLDPPPPDGAYWEPRNANAPAVHRSYHYWAAGTSEGLGLTWRDIADRRKQAEANPDQQAGFTNLICGEVFEGECKEQDADEILQLAEPGVHRGIVPEGAYLLTAGVDCQHDRFEVQVVAWGRGQRARVVDYAVLDGDPSRPDGYADLDTYLQGTWANLHGKDLHVSALAIDGGNWTEMVAQFVKSKVSTSGQGRMVKVGDVYRRQSVYLVRGRSEKKSERAVYRPSKTEVNQRDKTLARSVGLWGVGTSVLKHIIFGWLSSAVTAKVEADKAGEADPIDARMLRFPGGRGEVHDPIKPDTGALLPGYYKGLVCEYFDLDAQAWITPKGARNEPLDTLVYAVWAALSPAIKIDAMRESQWTALEAMFKPDPNDLFSAGNVRKDSRGTSTDGYTPMEIHDGKHMKDRRDPTSDSRETSQRPRGIVDGEWSFDR